MDVVEEAIDAELSHEADCRRRRTRGHHLHPVPDGAEALERLVDTRIQLDASSACRLEVQAIADDCGFDQIEAIGAEQAREHLPQRRADHRSNAVKSRPWLAEIVHRALDGHQDGGQRIDQRAVEIEQQVQAQFAAPSSVKATSAFWSLAPVAMTTNCRPDFVR